MKLLQATEEGAAEFTTDLMRLSANDSATKPKAGGGTVQGAGFSR
jgi:hypothetical protein